MNAPGWLLQVGGPNAITRWTWVGSVVANVASAGLTELESPGSVPSEWWLVLLTSVLILGLLMWFVKYTFVPGGRLAGSKRSRPVVAMAAFIGFGIERAVTLTIGASIVGFDERFTFVDRLVFGVAYSIVLGSLIALVVDSARNHRRAMESLAQARQAFESVLEQQKEARSVIDTDFLDQVSARLSAELAKDSLTPTELRGLAVGVVRASSHELADAQIDVGVPELGPSAPYRERLSERLAMRARAMRPPSPFAWVAIVETIAFALVAVYESPAVALVHVIVGGVLTGGGAWLFTRMYRPTRSGIANVGVILAGIVVVSLLAVLVTAAMVHIAYPEAAEYPAYVVTFVLVGLGLSMYGATQRLRVEAEIRSADAVRRLSKQVESAMRDVDGHRRRVAKFLHGPVQGILYSAALRGASPEEVNEQVGQAFAEFAESATDDTAEALRARFEKVVESWGQVLDLQVSVDPDAAQRAFSERMRCEALIDVVSEGLTNALKHGVGREVVIELQAQDGALTVQVTSRGAGAPRGEGGLGTRVLTDATESWTLATEADHVALTARIE